MSVWKIQRICARVAVWMNPLHTLATVLKALHLQIMASTVVVR